MYNVVLNYNGSRHSTENISLPTCSHPDLNSNHSNSNFDIITLKYNTFILRDGKISQVLQTNSNPGKTTYSSTHYVQLNNYKNFYAFATISQVSKCSADQKQQKRKTIAGLSRRCH